MVRKGFVIGLCLVATTSATSGSAVGQSQCSYAISSYNSAISDVGRTNGRFVDCVASSKGKDDCSFEFGRLRRAHSEFESAVSSISLSCRD